MKNVLVILMAGGLMFSGISKPQNQPSGTNAHKPGAVVNQAAEGKSIKYRFVVSFYSPGNGIDGEAVDRLEKFLASHPKKPVVDKIRWGREGEVDYCFHLKEFSTKGKKKFMEEAKKAIGTSERVRYEEHAQRVKK